MRGWEWMVDRWGWPAGWFRRSWEPANDRETGKRPHPRAYFSLLRSTLDRWETDRRTFDLHRRPQVSTVNAAGLCSRTCSYTPTSRSETEEQSEAGNAGSYPPIDGMPPAKFKVLYILASLSRDFYLELFFLLFLFLFFPSFLICIF